MSIAKRQKQLLDWYGRHRRVMPWRALKGQTPDPYHVWLSEIMLQQTTVVAVVPYFNKFIQRWPTVGALAKAKPDDVLAVWAGLGYYTRARNLHKCACAVVKEHQGIFPEDEKTLQALPGIGPYTATAISSIAFNRQAIAVDGNVERVVARFFGMTSPLPAAKKSIHAKAARLAKNNPCPSDFTQAFMELGATVCTPRKPKCDSCPWKESCVARKKDIAEDLPHRAAKKAKPVRYGRVFWICRKDGAFLIHKRPGKGLYEGMYQLPTTAWIDNKLLAKKQPLPVSGISRLRSLKTTVRHSFTHFDLVLEIWTGSAVRATLPHAAWIMAKDAEDYALPSLMKKAIRLCTGIQRI